MRGRLVVLSMAAGLAACATGPPPDTAPVPVLSPSRTATFRGIRHVPVTAADHAVTTLVPAGWTRVAGGSSALFTSGFDSVALDTPTTPVPPTTASVAAGDVPELEATNDGFVLGHVTAMTRQAGPAILVTFQALSPASPDQPVVEAVERYTFWRGTHEAVLTLTGPAGTDNTAPWRVITDSLRSAGQ